MGGSAGSSGRSAGRTGGRPATMGGGTGGDVERSPATVSVWDLGPGMDEKAVRGDIRAIFGRDLSLEQIASLAGAFHPSFRVTIRRDFPGVLNVSATGYIDGASVTLQRTIRAGKGGPRITNDFFQSGRTGTGVGTSVFAYQVRAAGAAGVTQIGTTAARSASFNGYYTWARLGYDAPMSGAVAGRASRAVGYRVSRVSDLMRTPQGRQWWRSNGTTRSMTFDPRPGSASRQRLEDYRAERARRSN